MKILGEYIPKKTGLLGKEMTNFCKQRGSPWFIIKVKIYWKTQKLMDFLSNFVQKYKVIFDKIYSSGKRFNVKYTKKLLILNSQKLNSQKLNSQNG